MYLVNAQSFHFTRIEISFAYKLQGWQFIEHRIKS